MRVLLGSILIISCTVLAVSVQPIFAEAAPVYDADRMPQSQSSGDGNYDERIQRLEQQIHNQSGGGDNSAHIDSLQDQIQALREQVDQVTHQLRVLQSQQQAQAANVEKRLASRVDDAPAPTKSVSSSTVKADKADGASDTATLATNPVSNHAARGALVVAKNKKSADADDRPDMTEEQQLYQSAYNFIKEKKYDDAATSLQEMLKKYPSGQFASNAHYWLGELYGMQSKNDLALQEFSAVITSFPKSPRVPDAQLKIGLVYSAQGKLKEAEQLYKKVIHNYPKTASAKTAAVELEKVKATQQQ
ncbi:MAG: tol-pal system protein YbgF [Gammaproteobacteria bacterium RIFCSPHIGHO2_12_FULL_42_10]|nr:MAG: tol-pal system protein YbgF [Gammaproteobacteria bacterium RIFCSPHIGHO2_12_FULL_42_10]